MSRVSQLRSLDAVAKALYQFTMRIVIAWFVLALFACHRDPTTAPIGSRSGTVEDVVRAVASQARRPLIIDPSATFIASCARISLSVPAGTPVSQLARLLSSALLTGSGLTLDVRDDGWILSRPRNTVVMPRECYGHTARVSDDSAVQPMMPAPPSAAATGADASGPERSPTIVETGAHQYTVSRTTLNSLFDGSGTIMNQARFVPFVNGNVECSRMFGIRPTSLFSTLGFQNGDCVESVNGYRMSSPEQALEAYSRIRSADVIAVTLLRRGQPLTIDYRVVP